VNSGFDHDPHSQSGFPCPRNSLGITDYAELQPIETIFVLKRTEELATRGIIGDFDSTHLKTIHRYLFQDIFPWAGEFRIVNISKGNSPFGMAVHIDSTLTEALAKLKLERRLVDLSPHHFALRAAYYLGEINAIHPFREGNGRTQREFLRQLALAADYRLSWAGYSQREVVDASIASHMRGDNTGLAAIIEAAHLSSRENASQP